VSAAVQVDVGSRWRLRSNLRGVQSRWLGRVCTVVRELEDGSLVYWYDGARWPKYAEPEEFIERMELVQPAPNFEVD